MGWGFALSVMAYAVTPLPRERQERERRFTGAPLLAPPMGELSAVRLTERAQKRPSPLREEGKKAF